MAGHSCESVSYHGARFPHKRPANQGGIVMQAPPCLDNYTEHTTMCSSPLKSPSATLSITQIALTLDKKMELVLMGNIIVAKVFFPTLVMFI